MEIRSDLKAGVVILVSAALSVVILSAAGRWKNALQKKQTIRVVFRDVQGLKVSDPVLAMGWELGKVEKMEIIRYKESPGLEYPAIEVTATIAYPEPFAIDSKMTASRSLTGSSELDIEPGRAAETFSPGQQIRGVAPASLADLGNQAGLVVQRLDEFIKDVTDRKVSGAAREAVYNLKQVSEDAKSVMASINRSVPGTEKSFVSSMKNFEQFTTAVNQSIGGGKDKINETISNVHSASQSLARVGENVDKMVAKDKDTLHHAVANADKATANINALTREVRWQPWLLLHKPGSKDIEDRGAYNAALDFSEGAETLNATVRELMAAMTKNDPSSADQEKLKTLAAQVHENLEKSVALERRLWESLNNKRP